MQEPGAKKLTALLIAGTMVGMLGLTGCGGDAPPASKPAESKAAESKPAASAGTVSESDHEKFEKRYVELCVKGQQQNPDSPVQNDQQLGQTCGCMAKAISKRLSKAEAVHFLDRKEIPIDIVMMGNAASDICAQPGQ